MGTRATPLPVNKAGINATPIPAATRFNARSSCAVRAMTLVRIPRSLNILCGASRLARGSQNEILAVDIAQRNRPAARQRMIDMTGQHIWLFHQPRLLRVFQIRALFFYYSALYTILNRN
jgi:hypothetical protein